MKKMTPSLENAISHASRVNLLSKIFVFAPFILCPAAWLFFDHFEPNWKADIFLIAILAIFIIGQIFSFFQYIRLRKGSAKSAKVLRILQKLWEEETPLKTMQHIIQESAPACHIRDLLVRWIQQGESGDNSGFDYLLDNSAQRRQHSEERMLGIHITLNRTALKLGFLGTLIGLLMTFPPMKNAILALKNVDGQMKFVSDIAGAIDGDQYAILTTLLATGFSVLMEILVILVLTRLNMRFEMANNYLEEWNIVEFRPRVQKEFQEGDFHSKIRAMQLALEQDMLKVQNQMKDNLNSLSSSFSEMQKQFLELNQSQQLIGKTVSELSNYEKQYQSFVRSRFNPLDSHE